MCGICGKFNFDLNRPVSAELLKTMADAIVHRGPDDEGYYRSRGVGLGFRRLSIIDLSTGHQPLSNEDGTVWIVFNGEIYNYRELRTRLEGKGHTFRTQTDTETIVHAFEEYGPECVKHLRGMFAFAIWDDRSRTLMLARDRVGIKPLYYRMSGAELVFGSEIKAILADPEVEADVNPELIDRFLSFYYMPGEETLFRNIRKLAPGSYLLAQNGVATTTHYWDLSFQPRQRFGEEFEEELLHLLEETVDLHMISDVPIGFLLSGGVDSTALLDFAAQSRRCDLRSYTVGFSGDGVIDERPYARLVAEKYGTEHHEMTIDSTDFAEFLPKFVRQMEEPVCEPPAVALSCITKKASESVKVLISGEGGDEAFAGYPNYRSLLWLERLKSCGSLATTTAEASIRAASSLFAGQKLAKFAPLLKTSLENYYYSRTSNPFHFFNANAEALCTEMFYESISKSDSLHPAASCLAKTRGLDPLSRMLYTDTKTWLPDDLLIKADKITMANSVELRVPLLDHKILEFAAALPVDQKVHGWTTKYLAKKALRKRVHRQIIRRKKAGFPVPYDAWLRGSLRVWVRDLLLGESTHLRAYFRSSALAKLLDQHDSSGKYAKEVFSLIVLELWHREFLSSQRAVPVHVPGERETAQV